MTTPAILEISGKLRKYLIEVGGLIRLQYPCRDVFEPSLNPGYYEFMGIKWEVTDDNLAKFTVDWEQRSYPSDFEIVTAVFCVLALANDEINQAQTKRDSSLKKIREWFGS